MPRRKGERKNDDSIGVLDFETDPFLFGRIPHPFAACIYFGERDFSVLWEDDSRTDFLDRVARALRRMPKCTLYAHNGGRFDFNYLLEYANAGAIEIRNNRITRMAIGNVTLKDSFPLMPFALEEFKKDKIDYAIFERRRRNTPSNRRRIVDYLIADCRYLRELLLGFREIVGPKDTIGASAFYQMRRLGIDIERLTDSHDAMLRPYFFGGRVQAFERGILDGPFQYIDINSAYPNAMLHEHAHGAEYTASRKLPKSPARLDRSFVRCIARSRGALPLRNADGTLSFPTTGAAEFCATGWEIRAGFETRTLEIDKVLDVWTPRQTISFRPFVETFYAKRLRAKREGDDVGRLAYKYLLNSGFGKFAQNPRDFKEYCLAPFGKRVKGYDWETDFGSVSLWSKPNYFGQGFYDVATGASITGFQRAYLWRGICQSKRVLYCDTDSILCKSTAVKRSDALGAWKSEGIVKRAAIAGKKLYGVEWADAKAHDGEKYKIASKGARLTWKEMLRLCRGEVVEWQNAAPTFSPTQGAHFIEREIRAT